MTAAVFIVFLVLGLGSARRMDFEDGHKWEADGVFDAETMATCSRRARLGT
jgi:hypothetical protein